jgi:hypothetical protein
VDCAESRSFIASLPGYNSSTPNIFYARSVVVKARIVFRRSQIEDY